MFLTETKLVNKQGSRWRLGPFDHQRQRAHVKKNNNLCASIYEGDGRFLAPSPSAGVWESVCLSVCRCNLSYQCNELFYSTLFSLIYPSLDSLTVTVDYVGGEFLLSWSPASPHLKPLRRPLRHSTAPHLKKKKKKGGRISRLVPVKCLSASPKWYK